MTVNELADSLGFVKVCTPDGDRQISGAYCGDLLSWVMGRASADNVWITIMSNANIVAVASLSDVSCILLAEGVTVEDEIIATAQAKGVNILSSEKSTFELAAALGNRI